MQTVEDLKRAVYIAPRSTSSGVENFSAPVLYQINWRVMSSDAEMQAFGPSYMDYRKAVVDNSIIDSVDELDAAWMDVTPSATTDTLATDADFYVASVYKGAGGIGVIVFKRRSVDG